MTPKQSNAARSVQTGRSAKNSSKIPFRKNSIREKAYRYLEKKRSYKQFTRFVEALTGDPVHLLRYFRMMGVVEEQDGKLWAK